MSSITVSSLVLGSLTVEVDGSDSTLALSVLGTAPASLSIELGTPGATGTAATIAVGTTTTLSPGSPATVTNVGTSSAATFNFGIPQGIAGPTGATGAGVPVGGTDGQVLAKIDATDYNTQWATAFALQVRNQVRNETGAPLTKGTVVYVTGASGNKVTVSKALATGDATSAQTFAVLLENIPNNQNGYAVTSGLLENLDTSAYAAGTQLYLSPTVAGTYTSTKPSAPDHLVYIGVIERSHVNQGTMLVRIQNGYELEELHNVAIAGLANNDLLAYDSATDLWKNKTFGTLGLLTSSTAASTYAPLASPALSGVPTAPTATAGTNTTQLATTAFVTAAVPAFATVTDVINNLTSSTTSVNPLTLINGLCNPNVRNLCFMSNTAVSGSGASGGPSSAATVARESYTNAISSAGRSGYYFGKTDVSPGYTNSNWRIINWSKKVILSGRSMMGSTDYSTNYNGDANTTCRIFLGGRAATFTTGSITQKGISLYKVGGNSSAVQLQVHDGTSATTVASSFTPASGEAFSWTLYSDGAGNVTLYINGSSVATSSAGPTGNSTAHYTMYGEQVEATASAAVKQILYGFGGQLYIET